MKNLKRLCVAIALTLTIAVSVFAGEIPSPPCAPLAPSHSRAPERDRAPPLLGRDEGSGSSAFPSTAQ